MNTDVRYEELNEEMKYLADIIGFDSTIKLIKECSGMQFYIPRLCNFDSYVKRIISCNQDKSVKDLAKIMGMSEYIIRKHYFVNSHNANKK